MGRAAGHACGARSRDRRPRQGGPLPARPGWARARPDRRVGGLDTDRIGYFKEAGAPVDSFAVGSAISDASPIDFTGDLKEIDGRPIAKRGRIPGRTDNPRLERHRPQQLSRRPWIPTSANLPTSCSVAARSCLTEHHPGAASVLLERCLALEPGKASIVEALARAYFDQGAHDRAAEQFQAMIDADPLAHYAHFGLGLSQPAAGRRGHGRRHLRMAVFLKPDNEDYQRALSGSTPPRPAPRSASRSRWRSSASTAASCGERRRRSSRSVWSAVCRAARTTSPSRYASITAGCTYDLRDDGRRVAQPLGHLLDRPHHVALGLRLRVDASNSCSAQRGQHGAGPGAEVLGGEVLAGDLAQVVVDVARADGADLAVLVEVLEQLLPGQVLAARARSAPGARSRQLDVVRLAALAPEAEPDRGCRRPRHGGRAAWSGRTSGCRGRTPRCRRG